MPFLYRLDFSSGKSYVGVTISLKKRLAGHARSALVIGSCCLVHKAWRKHGAPSFVVLGEFSPEDLGEAEQRAIKEFNTLTPGGYNMTPGGEIAPSTIPEVAAKIAAGRTGWRHTEETKARISAKKTGQPSARKGKTHTEESKMKMKISAKARTVREGRAK